MAGKTKTKFAGKGGTQVVAFKRQTAYAPVDEDDGSDRSQKISIIEMQPNPFQPLPRNGPPRRYNLFGLADDGGRYELLMTAIARGRLKMTKTMVGMLPPYSVVDAVTPTGENSLLIALVKIEDSKKRRKMFDLLINYGADVKYVNPNTGETIVHYCCKIPNRFNDLKWFLLRYPVEIDFAKPDFKGNNALHLAVIADDIQTAAFILKLAFANHCDLDQKNMHNLTPYLLANKLGRFEIADLIDKSAAMGISVLRAYLKSAHNNKANIEGRSSTDGDSDIVMPLPSFTHQLPSRFDGSEWPVRNRTALKRQGDEERLSKSLDITMHKRTQLLIRGQPEHLPRISLPSPIVRRQSERAARNKRSLANLDHVQALLPDYAQTIELKSHVHYKIPRPPNIIITSHHTANTTVATTTPKPSKKDKERDRDKDKDKSGSKE